MASTGKNQSSLIKKKSCTKVFGIRFSPTTKRGGNRTWIRESEKNFRFKSALHAMQVPSARQSPKPLPPEEYV